MANTYTQIHIQIVFSVKNRKNLIHKSWKNELYKYITGIIQNNNHKVLQINGTSDHIHILIGMRPTQSLSDLVKDIKGRSSKWINSREFLPYKFSWQEGFGGFSYAKSQVPIIINYIKNQEIHHKKTSFTDEYINLLEEFGVDYKPQYIFKPVR